MQNKTGVGSAEPEKDLDYPMKCQGSNFKQMLVECGNDLSGQVMYSENKMHEEPKPSINTYTDGLLLRINKQRNSAAILLVASFSLEEAGSAASCVAEPKASGGQLGWSSSS